MHLSLKMKRNLLSWITVVAMVFMSAAFAGCDKDKDNGGGSNTNGSSTMGDFTTSFNYGFYEKDQDSEWWWLFFANYDMNADIEGLNLTNLPENLDELSIGFRASTDGSIPTGDFSDFYVSFSRITVATGTEISFSGGSSYQAGDNLKLTISKSGNNYTVKYAGVDLYKYENQRKEVAVENSTFSFTGSLRELEDYDEEEE